MLEERHGEINSLEENILVIVGEGCRGYFGYNPHWMLQFRRRVVIPLEK
jgi:hypothetical protein